MKQEYFYTVAVTHKKFSLKEIGMLHADDATLKNTLSKIKTELSLKELV